MKEIFIIIIIFGLFACYQQANRIRSLPDRIDSLERKLAGTHKPGFGEFMSGMQANILFRCFSRP